MSIVRVLTLALGALVLSACGGGSSGGSPTGSSSTPGGPSVSTTGSVDAHRGESLTLVASGTDPQGRPLTFSWSQTSGTKVQLYSTNNAVLQFQAPRVDGDLRMSVTISNGTQSASASIVIHVTDTAPAIEPITFDPASPKRNDAITAQATAYDIDGDLATVTYVWRRNGVVVAGATGLNYPLGQQAKGDVISLTVTISDGTLSATEEAHVTIADTLPVLTGAVPTQISFGQPLSAQLSATDVDGDPIGTYELAYGPAGFSVSPSGQVSWTPSGPLFDRSTDMSWGVRLHDWPQAILSGQVTVSDPTRQYPLARSNAATPTQSAGLDIANFDGNGRASALVATANGVYEFARQGSVYTQTWMYPFNPAGDEESNTGFSNLPAVVSGDVNDDGHREIFFSQGPYIVELDGVSRREIARSGDGTAPMSALPRGPFCTQLRYGDIDNDGVPELVCLGATDPGSGPPYVFVYDARTLTLKWQSAQLPWPVGLSPTMALANVDNDPALEIIVSNGVVIDGATHQIEWQYTPGFGDEVDTGAVSGDGHAKIVALKGSNSTVSVFDAVTQSVLWSFQTPTGTGGSAAMKVARLEGAAPDSVVVGDRLYGNVFVYRYDTSTHTPQLRGQMSASGDGALALGIGDFDGDGHLDVMWSTTAMIDAGPHLVIASWTPSFAIMWDEPHGPTLDGAFVGAHFATTAPGTRRLLFGSPKTNGGYGGTRILELDPGTGNVALSSEVASKFLTSFAFDTADVSGTGTDTALFSTDNGGPAHFAGYDIASDSVSHTLPVADRFIVVKHADVNHDGYADVIGITSSGAVFVLDVHHQTQLWSSGDATPGEDVEVADLDGDGVPEIIALRYDGVTVYKGSGSNYSVQGHSAVTGGDLLVADVDGDGVPEIFIAGGVVSWLSNTLQTMGTYSVPLAVNLSLEESAYGRKNLIAGCSDTADSGTLVAFDPKSGAIVWTSPHFYGTPSFNSLSFVDVNNDGQREIAFGTTHAMYLTR